MITIVIPVYNEEENIEEVVKRIRAAIGPDDELLIINDGSTDKTAEILASLGEKSITHPHNIGNGAAIKTGIRAAKGDIIVMMDGDSQHDPMSIHKLLEKIGRYDMVVGARDAWSSGNCLRDAGNQIFNRFSSYLAKRKVDDLTSGFRAVKAKLAKRFVYLLPNEFSYPTTLTLSLLRAGYSISYVPIVAHKRKGKSKINPFADGFKFFLIMIKITTLFSPLRVFFPVSAFFILIGLCNYIYTFLAWHRFTNMSAVMIIVGVVVFLLGLISEQISQLRMEKTE